MASNRYFSSFVRILIEKVHTDATGGLTDTSATLVMREC
jgi:hypothetical protein